jgi:hypothetical protein
MRRLVDTGWPPSKRTPSHLRCTYAAQRAHRARAAVLAVVTAGDRPTAVAVTNGLLTNHPTMLVASGGAHGGDLNPAVHTRPDSIQVEAGGFDELLPEGTTA